MHTLLNQLQLRVIGCLIEKSLTTPDQYPLSINAIMNGCNQKSNREPVMNLTEYEVQEIIDSLSEKQLVIKQSGVSSRVQKYKHRFCNTEFGELQLSSQELAIICVLFLRGPQTPGELRTRTSRLCEFNNVLETEEVLSEMENNSTGAFVNKLARQPGKRESRYAHCFYDEVLEPLDNSDISVPNQNDTSDALPVSSIPRIVELEEKVELMQMEIDELRSLIVK